PGAELPEDAEAAGAAGGRQAAQVWLIDPRRGLRGVLDAAYVHRFASTAGTVKQRMAELAGILAARLPRDEAPG
ncbi:hypothetical protein, partial [Mycobacterium simiae]|uniref:hypothetical protein n=1 Tax=Mycobacterium simiae TaxID=1784 RepID=UPI00165FEB4D